MRFPTFLSIVAFTLPAGAAFAQSAIPNTNPVPATAPEALPPAPAQAGPHDGPNASGPAPLAPPIRPAKTLKGAATKILVYDDSTQHGLAATAAANLSPGGTTVATSATFDGLLTSQSWDVVAVDVPSTIPSGGWTALINHVNAGGRVVLSYWDWDAQPSLASAFDVTVSSSISLTGQTLRDSGVTPAFLGVTMPVSSWHDHWSDDGDLFTPHAGAQGLAHLGTPSLPVMVRGNGGRTIAAQVIDEAGDGWLADGSAVQLWENLIRMVADTSGPQVLVYDNDTIHHLAQLAAFESYPGTTQLANESTFNARLQSQVWDAVLMDCPNIGPAGGWSVLINYVNGGGHVVLSFWDWDNSSPTFSDPALPGAFDVSVVSSFGWSGLTLFDSGFTDVFAGVSMPNSSWHEHWLDDGDRFTPIGPAKGLAHVGSASQPVLVWGNAARTIAAPVFDEAGDTWLGNGSGVKLWQNMLEKISGPEPQCTFRSGILGLNPNDYTCLVPPVLGGLWVASVSTTPQTLSTFVTLGLGGPAQGIPLFGFELLILPPLFNHQAFGLHNIPVSQNPAFAGVTIATQGARVELLPGGVHVVLTNAQDILVGL